MLESFTRTQKAAQQWVERCRVVLLSAVRWPNAVQAVELGIDRPRVRRWRQRWARGLASLSAAEAAGATQSDLEKLIVEVLTDAAHSGAPVTFSAEQVVGMIALACEPPSHSGVVPLDPYRARQRSG